MDITPESQPALQRKRVTRKIRLKRYYRKECSFRRKDIMRHYNVNSKQHSLVLFIGNWNGIGRCIKGHSRRSVKPIIERLKTVADDATFVVDEYQTTITCSSFFNVNTKQIIRTANKNKKKIKGAVTCVNPECPKRLSTRSTTTNRDSNGALNIALVGFSLLVSDDNRPLPPFRRGVYNAFKYVIPKPSGKLVLTTFTIGLPCIRITIYQNW